MPERGRERIGRRLRALRLRAIAGFRQRSLRIVELTLRVAEVDVVETHPRFEDATARLGHVDLLPHIVERPLCGTTARRTEREARAEGDHHQHKHRKDELHSAHGTPL